MLGGCYVIFNIRKSCPATRLLMLIYVDLQQDEKCGHATVMLSSTYKVMSLPHFLMLMYVDLQHDELCGLATVALSST